MALREGARREHDQPMIARSPAGGRRELWNAVIAGL
jgi:hypothetical protein